MIIKLFKFKEILQAGEKIMSKLLNIQLNNHKVLNGFPKQSSTGVIMEGWIFIIGILNFI